MNVLLRIWSFFVSLFTPKRNVRRTENIDTANPHAEKPSAIVNQPRFVSLLDWLFNNIGTGKDSYLTDEQRAARRANRDIKRARVRLAKMDARWNKERIAARRKNVRRIVAQGESIQYARKMTAYFLGPRAACLKYEFF